ncbi:cysteine desulfurase family protein [Yunchengibacter salinarum]|uniref:cysteine desulfurase family protein n=1 Tax=Yunchengibacter salinarum TaxID=3133399 RepID=UPI0035B664C7
MITPPVYLDYQATTPVDERVVSAMEPYWRQRFGNPHSSTHRFGWEGEAALDMARETIAEGLGGVPEGVVFTSGATEANNLALKGVMQALGHARPHLVTVVSEHKCVLEAARHLERDGHELTLLGVDENGLVDPADLKAAVSERTALVSVMAVNNEIGVIQPLKALAAIAHGAGALFHTDAAQAFGKIPLDVADGLDLVSLSAHKLYGPKGVGALYVRQRPPLKLVPQMDGGGQEGGIRSGTQSPALVAGFARAARISLDERAAETAHIAALAERLKSRLFAELPGLMLNGHETRRWPGNLNLSFPGLDGDLLLAELRDLALSSGAACASAVAGPSYVLKAIGRTEAETRAALRIGIGRMTTTEEIDFAAETLIGAVTSLGGLRP